MIRRTVFPNRAKKGLQRMDLQNKVVIVTGASMGIGAAAARAFVAAGAKVALAARSEAMLTALVAELGAERALAVPADVTDPAQVQALVKRTAERFGRVDILVNNAGVGMAGAVATLKPGSFQQIFAVNVLGVLYGMQAVVPAMRQGGGGIIINISSMVSKLNIPTLGGYRATKTALNALTDNARMELKADNIRVITVYPNETATGFFDNTLDASPEARQPRSGRARQPAEQVAQRIVWGAQHEPREVYMSFGNQVFGLVGLVWPQFFENMMMRSGARR
jgi:NADP-dependent 3-hydroxy acid dehydrogenase YdfG